MHINLLMFSFESPGYLMGLLHWNILLREGNGWCYPQRHESQRPRMVWSCISTGIAGRLRHYVSTGEHLQVVQVRRLLQHQVPTMTVTTRCLLVRCNDAQSWMSAQCSNKTPFATLEYNDFHFQEMYWLI